MSNHQIIMYVTLAVLAYVVYDTLVKPAPTTFTAGSLGTPNAIAVPTTAPSPSVSSGSSVLTQAETGTNLFPGSGLGNNPVPQPTHELIRIDGTEPL